MAYERYPRDTSPQGDPYNRSDAPGYGGRPGYRDHDRDRDDDRYGQREYGYQRYGQYDRTGGQQDRYGANRLGRSGGYDRQSHDDRYGAQAQSGGGYRGNYGQGSHRFDQSGGRSHDEDYRGNRQHQSRDYGRQPQGYDYEDRGFFQRAGDEVRSWFGDDDAERRREADARYDERTFGGGRHDEDYHGWRSGQIAALDRDYDEYRQENRSRFEQEFATWRTGRQGQRDLLTRVTEHQEVVGSDGQHVGTVDKVRGDRILLTKTDVDAGGQHHSIPSRWIATVDDKVTLSKSADEAKQAWRDEDRDSASRTYGDNARGAGSTDRPGTNLNRSFSGTY